MDGRRIGFEFEYPVSVRSGLAITRRDASNYWEALTPDMPGWRPLRQQRSDSIIGFTRSLDGFAEHISNDTGVCTVEFALKPELTVFRAVDQAREAIHRLSAVANKLGFSLLCVGLQPITWADPQRKTTKDAYLSFKARMPYHAWSVPMASHQCSVDVDPDKAISVVNTLNALSGLIIALTASSPVAKGSLQEWDEFRTWVSDERSRRLRPSDRHYYSNGLPPSPFVDWNSYIEWFWASSTYFVKDEDQNISVVAGRRTFSQFLSAPNRTAVRVPGRPVRYIEPVIAHVNEVHGYGWLASRLRYTVTSDTTISEIRSALKERRVGDLLAARIERCYVEFRASGVSQQGTEGSVGALVLGLVEHSDLAEEIRLKQSWDQWKQLRVDGSVHGIRCLTKGGRNYSLAVQMMDVAYAGLKVRGYGEERLLEPLMQRLQSGFGYADRIRSWFHAGGVRRIVEESAWRDDARTAVSIACSAP